MKYVEPKPLPPGTDVNLLDLRLETALTTSNRHKALVGVVRELFAEGYDEGEALEVLDRFRAKLRQQNRDADEDDVMAVMDRLAGWCADGLEIRRGPASG